jgi:hypothetical protein
MGLVSAECSPDLSCELLVASCVYCVPLRTGCLRLAAPLLGRSGR